MAVSDGIGGTSVGAVLSQTATTKTIVSAAQSGSDVTLTLTTPDGLRFSKGSYLRLNNCTIDGVSTGSEAFKVALFPTDTTVLFRVPTGTTFALAGSPSVAPLESAFGLMNTRQAQIQGLQGGFNSDLETTGEGDDEWAQTNGAGAGLVPNASAPLPGGMTPPTTEYSVRRYMVNFALGTFTQDKLIPTKWLASQLAIEITLELPQYCIYQSVGFGNLTSNPTYMVGNVALIPEIIEFDDTYDNNFLAALESGGVPIKFATWNYYQFNTQSSSRLQLAITERSRSVKGILAVQRRAQGGFQYDSHACVFDSCTSSRLVGKASSMKEFQYRIGGRYFPGQPVELALIGSGCTNGGSEAYSELAKFLNIVGDARLSTNIIPLNWAVPATTHTIQNLLPEYDYTYGVTGYSAYGSPVLAQVESFTSAFCGNMPSCMFVAGINFETSNGMEISGLNAEEQADISFNVSWTEPQSPDHQIEVFTYCDRMWVIKVSFYF